MRRRVALLTANAPRPRLLLLDEPFSALDEPTRVSIHQDLYTLVRTYGITAILATHDLGEAISLSDSVAILSSSPARIVERHEVSVGVDRDILALRDTPEFLSLYAKLWDRLASEIRRGSNRKEVTLR
jgi:ABC-type nitrate/sulfonate/bicarbonate transport system ATPase subunit